MDIRGPAFTSGSNPPRFLCKESPLPRQPLRGAYVRVYRRFTLSTGSVASTGDFETESNDETPNDSPQRHQRSAGEEESRKKLEVVTGLLKEGYGVGAILTAAAFRGASITTDALKSLTQGGPAATRRQRVARARRRPSRRQNPSIVEKLQQAVSEKLTATPIAWARKDDHIPKAEMRSQGGASQNEESQKRQPDHRPLFQENAGNEQTSVSDTGYLYEDRSIAEPGNEEETEESRKQEAEVEGRRDDHRASEFKSLLGIPPEEPLSSRHISQEKIKPSAFLDAADEQIFGTTFPEKLLPAEPAAEEEHEPAVAFTEAIMEGSPMDVIEDLIEEQEAPGIEDVPYPPEECPTEVSSQQNIGLEDAMLESTIESDALLNVEEEGNATSEDASLAVHRAKEILDEIANFEIETGVSVDLAEEERTVEESLPEPLQKTRAEKDQELKEQMRMESERRLRAMKIGNSARHQREAPVKVERPSTQRDGGMPSPASASSQPASMAPPTQDFKGLDYIKSYAKESQHASGDSAKDNSSFFTPPSILQETKKTQVTQASTSSARGYNQWREVDRLKRVREIGTVLWLGRGGPGGNGGDGGSGGGGRPGDNSDDKHWWIQVGVSMMTMTALVFALLTAISNQLEKQQRTEVKGKAA